MPSVPAREDGYDLMGNLTTKANVKSFLGITDTSADTFLDFYIPYASAVIENYCNRVFGEATYADEISDGDGSRTLLTRQWPIIAVTSLYDDTGRTWGSASLIATTDYVVDKRLGLIKLDKLKFFKGVGNVKVTYSAGYKLPGVTGGSGDLLPGELEDVCIKLMAKAHKDRGSVIGLASINFEGGTKSFMTDLPLDIQRVLQRYRRVSL